MFSANQRLPDGNQILARIMSLLKLILGKRNFLSTSMFRRSFLKIFFKCFFFGDEILLAGAAVPLFNSYSNKEFTGKSSLTSSCTESIEKKIMLVSRTKGGITVKPGQESIHELIINLKVNPFVASVTCTRYQIAFKRSVNFGLELFSIR